MRKIPLWEVSFYPQGILEGTVNVAADKAEEAIQLVRETVSHPDFELRSVQPLEILVLWEDVPSSVMPTETVVQHEGRQYAAGASMPKLETVQDSPEETTPRDPINTELEQQAAKALATARDEMIQMGKDGVLDPNNNYERIKDGH